MPVEEVRRMERLTIPAVRVDEHTTRMTMIDARAVKNHAMDFYWRLKAYEDTERTPEEVTALGKLFDYALKESKTLTEQLALLNRIRDLAEADKAGRLVVLPSNKALTNADRMRTATNQQLAKQLYDNQKEFCRILYKNLGFGDELTFSEDYSDILAWLNAPEKMGAAQEATKDE